MPCTLSSMRHLAREAFDLGAAELQLQAWGSTPRELYNCGMDLYALDDRIVVKVPITLTGLKAARLLSFDGVPFTLTGEVDCREPWARLPAAATPCFCLADSGRVLHGTSGRQGS